jgi:hypothetical protein
MQNFKGYTHSSGSDVIAFTFSSKLAMRLCSSNDERGGKECIRFSGLRYGMAAIVPLTTGVVWSRAADTGAGAAGGDMMLFTFVAAADTSWIARSFTRSGDGGGVR